ncbi:MAG TPA: hypothetical protein VNO52_13470 [Methylomirabilota bacterium]|nr:hypothetical protein [Methylomirabilota bacterium]
MFQEIDTRVPGEVERQVQQIYLRLFPAGDRFFVATAFDWAGQCFEGRHPDYQPIDARYHDFEHTLQGTLCLARLLEGRHRAQIRPELPERQFQLALLAILFHDTGYLKRRDDHEGTGAKYTLVHVARSTQFAADFLSRQGFQSAEIRAVQNMISCTGVNADLDSIPFQNDTERLLGFALASADLLGQMAARDYIDKLPVLFLEFREAARQGGDKAARFAAYTSAEALMRNTPEFWHGYVLPRIQDDFEGVYRFLNDPYPDGPNEYIRRVEANLERLRRKLEAGS